MRWSELAVRTLREAPAGARNDRERLLARAGLARLGAGGTLEWLPLGHRVLTKAGALLAAPTGGAVADGVAAAASGARAATDLLTALTRCGLRDVVVAAGPGVTLYLVPCATGATSFLRCAGCGYAATAGVATSRVARAGGEGAGSGARGATPGRPPIEKRPTPGVHTIAQLAEASGEPADRQIKILFYRIGQALGAPAHGASTAPVHEAPRGTAQLVAALVRGDRALSEVKLARVLGVPGLALATRDEIADQTGAPTGSAGPVGLRGARLVADDEVMVLVDTVCGANQEGYHFFNVNPGRDFAPDLVADIRTAGPGDACPRCGKTLEALRGIVVARGSVLPEVSSGVSSGAGTRPAGAAGEEPVPDLGNLVAAVVEQHHDEAGIAWPLALAPCQAVVVPVNAADPAQLGAAETIHRELLTLGVEAVLDDRDERAGVKFTDADLIGFPFRITVGPRSLAEGQAEVLERATRAEARVRAAEAAGWVLGKIRPPA